MTRQEALEIYRRHGLLLAQVNGLREDVAVRLATMERERDEALGEAHAAAKENEAMLLAIEKLSAELAKPEDVRLREAVDAMGDRCPQFFSIAGRIDRLLDDVDEWIGRAGSAERTVEEQGRLLASPQNVVRELQSAPNGDAHVDGLHRRIDALVAIAEAAEALCGVVGERAADGDFNPLPQASLTGAVREEIAPHVFRQWAAAKAALHRAEIGAEYHEFVQRNK